MKIKQPSPQTLRKYGLTLADWTQIMDRQGWMCAVCKKVPGTGRLCIDHEHVRGWKKMPDNQRKKYVRGCLCWTCNAFLLARGVTLSKLESAITYLKTYQNKKENNLC